MPCHPQRIPHRRALVQKSVPRFFYIYMHSILFAIEKSFLSLLDPDKLRQQGKEGFFLSSIKTLLLFSFSR